MKYFMISFYNEKGDLQYSTAVGSDCETFAIIQATERYVAEASRRGLLPERFVTQVEEV